MAGVLLHRIGVAREGGETHFRVERGVAASADEIGVAVAVACRRCAFVSGGGRRVEAGECGCEEEEGEKEMVKPLGSHCLVLLRFVL
ncbi:hypothetical protein JHK82_013827 [Glycine max]|nr:hypothetical protein JHK87_013740 [Glycine soja]KAG5041729.1 hypothetical protein JHK85_014205 [Glycine max]KAG5058844.1 hypothetical protein JHK86_013840 [Glycine max]KAG5155858.1 hypothetical protein JHK82_013827 [Glycine max]